MSLDYIRRTYDVPARRGMRVSYAPVATGQPVEGVIVGARQASLRVRITKSSPASAVRLGDIVSLHPTWRIGYDVPGGVDGTDRVTKGVAHD